MYAKIIDVLNKVTVVGKAIISAAIVALLVLVLADVLIGTSFGVLAATAKLIGVSTETLRRWDKSGKFESIRHNINNYRVYQEN